MFYENIFLIIDSRVYTFDLTFDETFDFSLKEMPAKNLLCEEKVRGGILGVN